MILTIEEAKQPAAVTLLEVQSRRFRVMGQRAMWRGVEPGRVSPSTALAVEGPKLAFDVGVGHLRVVH